MKNVKYQSQKLTRTQTMSGLAQYELTYKQTMSGLAQYALSLFLSLTIPRVRVCVRIIQHN